ncbi:TPA: hypothetical protein DCE37_01485 [Candidatus Latescibacteria bacterium]|nr:hypothetical protein [Candidatus Latescibacterota bacterium]
MPYHWTCISNSAYFAPRDGAGALVYEDTMWLIGGWNPRHNYFPRICTNDVWRSENGADWVCVKPNTFGKDTFDPETDWEGRHTAGYAVHDGRMWIVAGDCNQGHYHSDVWSSEDGVTWDRSTDQVPWALRTLHYTVAHDGWLWVIGVRRSHSLRLKKNASTTTSGDRVTTTNGSASQRTSLSLSAA